MSKMALQGIKSNLQYAKEDVEACQEHAKAIKDPELTKKLSEIHTGIEGVKAHIKAKTDSKTG